MIQFQMRVFFGTLSENNLVTYPGFETAGGGGADVFAGWNELTAGASQVVDEVVNVHGGGHAAKLVSTATNNSAVYKDIIVVPGRSYLLSMWTRGDGSDHGRFYVYDADHAEYIVEAATNEPGTDYVQVTAGFVAPAGCTTIQIGFKSPEYIAATVYFDDISLIDLKDIIWTLCEDVLQEPVPEWEYGIVNSGPSDLVASTGVLKFVLDNSDQNSAGLAGLYSPENDNLLAGFAEGMLVKVEVTVLETGWFAPNETWTYASATTFTVPGDQTVKYHKGTKIKLTQTTEKYFYVIGSSYGAPNTTVTVTGGSDYSLANAAITLPFFSYAETPQGFPGWFNWTPTPSGYSVTNAVYRFFLQGRKCTVMVREATVGNSTNTVHTLTAPVPAVTLANALWITTLSGTDNSVTLTVPGRAFMISAGTTITLGPQYSVDVWTAAG
ncbi:MAG TPA: carbohydrate binding domain-containing protein, partial [Candidatus Acidoferrales bacterium]|nr:carbohydrate binding domain-containing protein [Candidatus Acidoferrales bacterium]